MKKFLVIVLTLFFVGFGVSGALATSVLYDWAIDVNGTVYEVWPEIYEAPTVSGEITGVSGFTMFTPTDDPYGYDVPDAIGTITVTFDPGAAGNYNIEGYFDVEIDEWINTYYNETGATGGTASGGVYGSVLNDAGDIAWEIGWDFALADDEYAVVNFIVTSSNTLPGYYLSQTDPDSQETIYLTSTLGIVGDSQPIPEPGTMFLLGTGLVGLFGLGRKKFKKS